MPARGRVGGWGGGKGLVVVSCERGPARALSRGCAAGHQRRHTPRQMGCVVPSHAASVSVTARGCGALCVGSCVRGIGARTCGRMWAACACLFRVCLGASTAQDKSDLSGGLEGPYHLRIMENRGEFPALLHGMHLEGEGAKRRDPCRTCSVRARIAHTHRVLRCTYHLSIRHTYSQG